jgi:hypothetical protein
MIMTLLDALQSVCEIQQQIMTGFTLKVDLTVQCLRLFGTLSAAQKKR